MVKINQLLKKIYRKIKKYDEIVIARHIGPDPDAVASQIALRDSIRLTFPDKKVITIGAGVARFKFFGNLDKMIADEFSNPLLIVLDLPNTSRLDGITKDKFKEIIKIDHHPFEETTGKLEWIDDTASSTSQMVTELIFNTNLKINQKIAENLFMGIVSDSERFLFSYTTSKTFYLVHKLLELFPLDIEKLYGSLYERPLAELKFQGFIAENLIVTENGLGSLNVKAEDIKKYGVDYATPSNLINSFNYIKEMLAWVFITYDPTSELYRVSIRSRGPVINEIAAKYNGGGHKMASGCRIKESSDIDKLLQELDAECKKYKEKANGNQEL